MGPATLCPLGLPGMVFSQAMPSTDASDESTTDDGASAEEDEVDSDEWSEVDEYDDRWRGFDPDDIWDDM
eukprot:6739451-Lingulodinium_polyedra.AAC.1